MKHKHSLEALKKIMEREYILTNFRNHLQNAPNASSSSPVLNFPSAIDTDSIYALNIPTHIFPYDSLRYSYYPFFVFGDMDGITGRNLLSDDQAVTVLLIIGDTPRI